MLCRDIMEIIERTYPKHAAMEWDNVGLLVGRADKDVAKIYVALDPTDDVIDEAIERGADLLVTHHPLVFSPMKQITDEHFISGRVVRLLQHDVSYYAIHTNYDILGMADLSAEMLDLECCQVLEPTDAQNSQGLGRVGNLPKAMTLLQICELVKTKFGLEHVKVYGNNNGLINRVAISPGSGKHMSDLAIDKNADVFITAEIDHHEGIDAMAQGMAIVDAGHYGLEHIFIEDMALYLKKHVKGVEVEQAAIKHPFFIV